MDGAGYDKNNSAEQNFRIGAHGRSVPYIKSGEKSCKVEGALLLDRPEDAPLLDKMVSETIAKFQTTWSTAALTQMQNNLKALIKRVGSLEVTEELKSELQPDS